MAKKIIDLDNHVLPDTDNPDGRLKNQVYSGATVTEVGSEVEADYDQDVLNVFLWLLRQAGGTPSGVADTQADSQYIDALVAKIDETAGRAAVQQALSNFREMDIAYGPAPWFVTNSFMVYGNGVWLIGQYLSAVTAMKAYVVDGVDNTDNTLHGTGTDGDIASFGFWSGVNFIYFENVGGSSNGLYCYTATDAKTWTKRTIDAAWTTADDDIAIYTAFKLGSDIFAIPFSTPSGTEVYKSVNDGVAWTKESGNPGFDMKLSASNGTVAVIASYETGSVAKYSTNGTTWTTMSDTSGHLITQLVYNGKRFILVTDSTTYFISDEDDPSTLTEITLPYGAINVNSVFVSNGVTFAYDPVSDLLLSATQDGIVSGEWKVHKSPFTTTGAPITDNRLVGGNDEQILIAGHDTDPDKMAITPPIQR
jgi:hypothetical protein